MLNTLRRMAKYGRNMSKESKILKKKKDITRSKAMNIFRTGLAVDLRRMPSTCPCRASIQGYRGSSQY